MNNFGPGQMSLYIVRHGQTLFNVQQKVQGFSDSPLTELGQEQGRKVGNGLKNIPFATAFASDLQRQRDTARLILEQNSHPAPALEEIRGLREWNCGGFEGRPIIEMWGIIFKRHGLPGKDIASEYKQLVAKLGYEGIIRTINDCDPARSAETYEEIMQRTALALRQVISQTIAGGGGNALVVTSGGLVRSILHLLAPGQYQNQSINNCAVSILHYNNGEYDLAVTGDESYLNGQSI